MKARPVWREPVLRCPGHAASQAHNPSSKHIRLHAEYDVTPNTNGRCSNTQGRLQARHLHTYKHTNIRKHMHTHAHTHARTHTHTHHTKSADHTIYQKQ